MDTTLITVISCCLIVAAFVYFMYYAVRIKSHGSKSIDPVLNAPNALDALAESNLSPNANEYRKTINIGIDGKRKSNVPASEYFSEFTVCKSCGINTRIIDAGAGTLVGLGLLGTFLGLTLGIHGFDSSNSANIQSSIQSLLDGMGTAFVTSLLGMSFSLAYTIFEKLWRNGLETRLYDLNQKLDDAYFIDDAELNAYHQKMTSEKLMKSVSEELNTVAITMYDKIKHLLQYQNADGHDVPVANAVREILSNNEEQTRALKSFSSDLALELNDRLDETLSRQMQMRLIPLMESVDATTRTVVSRIDQMAALVSSPLTDMFERVISDLKESLMTIMEEFKVTVSKNTASELENLAETLSAATKAIGEFPENIASISNVLQLTINEVRSAITEISNSSAASNSSVMKQMQEQIVFATSSISNAITEVKDVMNNITRSSEQSSKDLIEKVAKSTADMNSFMQATMEKVSGVMQTSVQSMSADIASKQTDLLTMQQETIVFATDSINNAITEVKDVMSTITRSSEQSSNELIEKVAKSTTDMNSFMQSTMERVSGTMQASVQSMSADIAGRQTDLLALQQGTTEEVRKVVTELSNAWRQSTEVIIGRIENLLSRFDNSVERMSTTTTAVSGTMDLFQQAQANISGTTAHLQTISGDMKTATETFRKGQEEYSLSLEKMQKETEDKLHEVVELYKTAGDSTEEYVEKFEIIKTGLGQIFSQIQSGLAEYSRSVSTSLQKYLDSYSASLTSTTDALASTIERQNEMVEMLVDTVNSHKKR